MASTPTIVLVPGAWCTPIIYDPLRAILTSRGLPSISPAHPSIGAEPPSKTLADDVAHLRSELVALIEEGKDVVVVLHSYGGVVGSGAVEGLGKAERAQQGKQGGVVLVVYMTAFVLPKGVSLVDMLGGQFLPFMKAEGDYVHCIGDAEAGFHDIPSEDKELWESRLTHASIAVFSGASTYEPWRDIPTAYIICEEERALPLPVQEQMAQALNTQSIYRLKSSHSPYLSMPDKLADIVEELADKAAATNQREGFLQKL
ncbi:alpha/beta-hydrolase [Aspergillus sclerotiicarbonarius CBS 121057]|uniref:Alpha/beta-hydrolase n=1 Tax=Aspergillus sclerotiicarbonarius (strain CBS 121057 / IBT 28362) TaxID=1448318 RepID=A0A319EGE1_ASPSB|nr:alpha/beta-hydrolase [Aspergillus sclerotiicarbonarius CBS 121057]